MDSAKNRFCLETAVYSTSLWKIVPGHLRQTLEVVYIYEFKASMHNVAPGYGSKTRLHFLKLN